MTPLKLQLPYWLRCNKRVAVLIAAETGVISKNYRKIWAGGGRDTSDTCFLVSCCFSWIFALFPINEKKTNKQASLLFFLSLSFSLYPTFSVCPFGRISPVVHLSRFSSSYSFVINVNFLFRFSFSFWIGSSASLSWLLSRNSSANQPTSYLSKPVPRQTDSFPQSPWLWLRVDEEKLNLTSRASSEFNRHLKAKLTNRVQEKSR